MSNGLENAFPIPADEDHGRVSGLTKREYFAAMAMQGLSPRYAQGGDSMAEFVARLAVENADALLAELAKS